MKTKKQNVTVTRSSLTTIDLIKQSTDSGVPIGEILSLGNVSIDGETSMKIQYDEWYVLAQLTNGLHKVLSEILKPKKKWDESNFNNGLLDVLNQSDIFYQTHPDTFLINGFSEDGIRFNLGYVGLMRNYKFDNLSDERKNVMYNITKSCRMFIAEVLKTSEIRDYDKYIHSICEVIKQSVAFRRSCRGASLLLDMNPPD